MHLQESGEMYLETILILSKTGKNVRSVDVSEYMGFSKPSVSRAIGLLKSGGYVTVDKGGHLELTEAGRAVAENIFEKHTLLSRWLMALGVDEETATQDACRMEHGISDTSFKAIKKHAGREEEPAPCRNKGPGRSLGTWPGPFDTLSEKTVLSMGEGVTDHNTKHTLPGWAGGAVPPALPVSVRSRSR